MISENITTLRLRFLLRNDEQIIVPMGKQKEIKTFLFRVDTKWLQEDQYDGSDFGDVLF